MDEFETCLVCKIDMNCEEKRIIKIIYQVFYWNSWMDVGAIGVLEEQQAIGENTVFEAPVK